MYYDSESVCEIIENYIKTFRDSAAKQNLKFRLYIVELVCDNEERFRRNVSESRLIKKPSKKNIEWTTNEIKNQIENRRIIANEEDIKRFSANNFLSINNTNIKAEDVAQIIKSEFNI